MNPETERRFAPYQTDHLLLLVGSNPLPNYVAAQLLLKPGGVIYLLCSGATQGIAERLGEAFDQLGLRRRVLPHIDEGLPATIHGQTRRFIESLGSRPRIGLHYTGGTKAMAVHAYRAVQGAGAQSYQQVVFSYLDARALAMVIDGALDGRDLVIPIANAIQVKVDRIASLHGITFKKPESAKLPDAVYEELGRMHGAAWESWKENNLLKPDSRKPKSPTDLKTIAAPEPKDGGRLQEIFARLGAPAAGATLEDWGKAAGYLMNREGTAAFVEQLRGGFWLEHRVAKALETLRHECAITDIRTGLVPDRREEFEFDVTATQGYRLYGISCTVSDTPSLCKSKLMEAYIRARQLGGDEARVALVCGSNDPAAIHDGFKSSNYVAEDAVRVFGRASWDTLAAQLKEWMKQ